VTRQVVELLASRNRSVILPAVRTIGNIVAGTDVQTQVAVDCGVVGRLNELLASGSRHLRKEALRSLSNITAGTPEHINAVIEANAVPSIIALSKATELEIREEALWTLSNLAQQGSNEQVTYAAQQGILGAFCNYLSPAHESDVVLGCLDGIGNVLKVNKAWRNMLDDSGMKSVVELSRGVNIGVAEKAQEIFETYLADVNPNVKSARKEGTRS
jgi:importin subunit alpha-6/7